MALAAFEKGIANPFPKGSRPFHMYAQIVAEHRKTQQLNPAQAWLARLVRALAPWARLHVVPLK